MTANATEDGYSERQAAVLAIKNLLERGQDFITRNQLRSVAARMKPVVSAGENAKQGSLHPEFP